ncbi:hypothetical protein HMPREF3158_10740 [Corynebacterium sp. HMSC06G04]|uniref:Rv3212 family protein n=1 Tax=Corynebacterium sp. HMSC06G04 TaxID=1581126 RepID=UPI0008A3C718|nr:hypothetical protein [Corynebacterium sp. HMSC06G04]OFT44743.1 hypothetical protein HMPREF3158_10740 [Corynebacterium sp. HMSC06G04]
MSKTPILRASATDWKLTGAIAAVCAIAVGGAYFSADIRDSELVPASHAMPDDVEVLAEPPVKLAESFRLPNTPVPGQYRALSAKGLTITHEGETITASDPNGNPVWHYTRAGLDLCSLGTAWGKVVATYRTGVGCGDTVAIDAATGQYSDTRSAINSEDVVAIASNDRVGTVSTERVDIWRSDMVRTIEYGDVKAKQEPDMQEHEECSITSALTRTENLAVTESCPENPNVTSLRLMGATPEDSRKPEISADVTMDNQGSRLIAVGQKAAAVYQPGETPRIDSYSETGEKTSSQPVASSPEVNNSSTPFAPATADLPHHMSWFDGQRLYLFTPTTLKVDHVLEDAIGTGVAVGDRLLMPTDEGIAVVNWSTGETERSIPVDRGDYEGPVFLTQSGTTIVEQRSDTAVGLSAL